MFLNAKQYKNKPNFVMKATPTAMTDGKWNGFVVVFDPATRSLID